MRKNLDANYVNQYISREPHNNCRKLDAFLILEYKEREANLNDSWDVVLDVSCWIVTHMTERNNKLD
jgi:hypothetical protein